MNSLLFLKKKEETYSKFDMILKFTLSQGSLINFSLLFCFFKYAMQ